MRVSLRGGARGEGVRRNWRERAGEHAGRACEGTGVHERETGCAGGGWRAGARCEQRRDEKVVRRGEVVQHAR